VIFKPVLFLSMHVFADTLSSAATHNGVDPEPFQSAQWGNALVQVVHIDIVKISDVRISKYGASGPVRVA